jgi:internalin A
MQDPRKSALWKWRWLCLIPVVALALNSWGLRYSVPYGNLWRVLHDATGRRWKTLTRESLEGLTRLDAYQRGIGSLAGIQNCTHLETLNLRNPELSESTDRYGPEFYLSLAENHITDLHPLAPLSRLEYLNLTHNPITDITPLGGLKALKELRLGGNGIEDFSPIGQLTELRKLSIGNSEGRHTPPNSLQKNRTADLRFLQHLTQREELEASRCQISDVSGISGLHNLKVLYLAENEISDVSPLAHLKNLQTLSLAGNQIKDISPLAGLNELRSLDLFGNPITDWEPLLKMGNLVQQSVRGVPPEIRMKLKWEEKPYHRPKGKLKGMPNVTTSTTQ